MILENSPMNQIFYWPRQDSLYPYFNSSVYGSGPRPIDKARHLLGPLGKDFDSVLGGETANSSLSTSPFWEHPWPHCINIARDHVDLGNSGKKKPDRKTDRLDFLWCRRRDSNSHGKSPTTPSRWRVYQFHHFGERLVYILNR